jgi:hypothetical protein
VAQESALHFRATISPLKVLPVEPSMGRGTTNIITLKKRALSPVVQLFIEHLREAADDVKQLIGVNALTLFLHFWATPPEFLGLKFGVYGVDTTGALPLLCC